MLRSHANSKYFFEKINFDNLRILHKEDNFYKLKLIEQLENLKNEDNRFLLNEISKCTLRDNILR